MLDPELNKFVQTVKTLTQNTGNGRELMVYLDEQKYFLEGFVSRMDGVLAALDINEHRLAILMVLNVDASTQPTSVPVDLHFVTVASRINHFVSVVRADVFHSCSKTLASVVQVLLRNLHKVKKTMMMIPTIQRAIDKLQTKPHQLTHFHYLLCEACIMSYNLKASLKVLDQEVYFLNSDEPKIIFEPKYFLNYYFSGGLIYTAMKNYDRAITLFEIVFMTTFPVVSPITIDSYKKFILLVLIHFGSVPTYCNVDPTILGELYGPTCQPYLDLVPLYQSGNLTGVHATIAKHQDIYVRDKNFGLVKQLLKSLNQANLLRLANLFSTMTLADLAEQLNLKTAKDAVNYLLTMRKSNVLHYKIDEKKGIATSNINVDYSYEHPDVLIGIIKEIEHKIEVSKILQSAEENVKTYIPQAPIVQSQAGPSGVLFNQRQLPPRASNIDIFSTSLLMECELEKIEEMSE
ncbi:COP9 signalosome complex subunit 3-like isoform X2 [Adelges cooleyi]|uniref:COP9 signalosome complex subunit 3-like isoform X2 n=1 Tax=Adelges cooleyi TaxID=133065 RepID=UPI0021804C39|nr:COP9 signalosome complex subunit 3-like isoform X2 [Adelges cooleyi]XP_050437795.1 COP9 signalosome complex subunit 3-like isoform X2 [Adelges cooleyi]